MITEEPLDTEGDTMGRLIIGLASMREVPDAACNRDKELRAPNDECTDPEKPEEVIYPYIASRVIPLDVCEDGSGPLDCSTHGVNVNS